MATLALSHLLLCQSAAKPDEVAAAAEYDAVIAKAQAARERLQLGCVTISGTIATRYDSDKTQNVEGPYRVFNSFDHGKKRWRFDVEKPGQVVNYDTIDIEPGGKSATVATKLGVVKRKFAVDGEMVTYWDADNAMCAASSVDNDLEHLNHDTYDVRALGMYHPIQITRRNTFSDVFNYYKSPGIKRTCVITRHPGGIVRMQRHAADAQQTTTIRITNELDEQREYVPLSHHQEINFGNDKWVEQFRYTMTWDKHSSGVYIPATMKFVYRGKTKDARGVETPYTDELDLALQWKGVNQDCGGDSYSYKSFDLPAHIGISETTPTGSRVVRPPQPDPDRPSPARPKASLVPPVGSDRRVYLAASLALLGLGLIGFTALRRRRTAPG